MVDQVYYSVRFCFTRRQMTLTSSDINNSWWYKLNKTPLSAKPWKCKIKIQATNTKDIKHILFMYTSYNLSFQIYQCCEINAGWPYQLIHATGWEELQESNAVRQIYRSILSICLTQSPRFSKWHPCISRLVNSNIPIVIKKFLSVPSEMELNLLSLLKITGLGGWHST